MQFSRERDASHVRSSKEKQTLLKSKKKERKPKNILEPHDGGLIPTIQRRRAFVFVATTKPREERKDF